MEAEAASLESAPSRVELESLIGLIEQAFEGDEWQSLLANLRDLRENDWTALPPNGGRSISAILEHVGWSKWMYEDYAYGTARLQGNQPPLIPNHGLRARPRSELMTWLIAGHQRWLMSVRALANDAELERARLTNWGEWLPTRQIIRMMIGQDYYHAGEINPIRAVLQGNDRCPYD